MLAPRGIRAEDRIANQLAQTLVVEGRRLLSEYRQSINEMSEIIDQRTRAQVTNGVWETYITRLALASFAGEDTLHIIADFNQRYIFPYRKERETLRARNG